MGSQVCNQSNPDPCCSDYSDELAKIIFELGKSGGIGGPLAGIASAIVPLLETLKAPDLSKLIAKIDNFDSEGYNGESRIVYDEFNSSLFLLIDGEFVEVSLSGSGGGSSDAIETIADVGTALANLISLYAGSDPNLPLGDDDYVDPGDAAILLSPDSLWFKNSGGTWTQWQPQSTDEDETLTCAQVVQCALDDILLGLGTSGTYSVNLSGPPYSVGDIHTNFGVYALDTINAATMAELVDALNEEFVSNGYPLVASEVGGVLHLTSENQSVITHVTDKSSTPANLIAVTEEIPPSNFSKLIPPLLASFFDYLSTNSGMAQWVAAYNDYIASGNPASLNLLPADVDLGTHADESAAETAAITAGNGLYTATVDGCKIAIHVSDGAIVRDRLSMRFFNSQLVYISGSGAATNGTTLVDFSSFGAEPCDRFAYCWFYVNTNGSGSNGQIESEQGAAAFSSESGSDRVSVIVPLTGGQHTFTRTATGVATHAIYVFGFSK